MDDEYQNGVESKSRPKKYLSTFALTVLVTFILISTFIFGLLIWNFISPSMIITGASISNAAPALLENLTTADILSPDVILENATIAKDTALNALLKAEEDRTEISQLNTTTYLINDLLLKAKFYYVGENLSAFNSEINQENSPSRKTYLQSFLVIIKNTPENELLSLNYTEVLKLTRQIAEKKQQALNIYDQLALIKEESHRYQEEGVDISFSQNSLDKALTSFNAERYDEANTYLEDANTQLDQAFLEFSRYKKINILPKNFLERYWILLIVILIILIVSTPLAILRYRKVSAKRKAVKLRKELENLNKLIIAAQEDYFKKGTITKETYNIRIDKYSSRILEVKESLLILEGIIDGKKNNKNISKIPKRKGVLEITDSISIKKPRNSKKIKLKIIEK